MPILDLTGRLPQDEREKLPNPSNDGLRLLFEDIDKVVIKDGGVFRDKALSDMVLLTLAESADIADFFHAMELDEQQAGFYCMCSGTYAIDAEYSGRLISEK